MFISLYEINPKIAKKKCKKKARYRTLALLEVFTVEISAIFSSKYIKILLSCHETVVVNVVVVGVVVGLVVVVVAWIVVGVVIVGVAVGEVFGVVVGLVVRVLVLWECSHESSV